MIFTIEPMVNQGKNTDEHWPDKYAPFLDLITPSAALTRARSWTAVTKDGKLTAQFEETLLITPKGVEVLTAAPGWQLPEEFRKLARGEVVNEHMPN